MDQVVEVESTSEVHAVILGELSHAQTIVWLTMTLNGHESQFKLDTGAEVTAISEKIYKILQNPQMTTSKKALDGPARQPLDCMGQFQGQLHSKNKISTQVCLW